VRRVVFHFSPSSFIKSTQSPYLLKAAAELRGSVAVRRLSAPSTAPPWSRPGTAATGFADRWRSEDDKLRCSLCIACRVHLFLPDRGDNQWICSIWRREILQWTPPPIPQPRPSVPLCAPSPRNDATTPLCYSPGDQGWPIWSAPTGTVVMGTRAKRLLLPALAPPISVPSPSMYEGEAAQPVLLCSVPSPSL
jgi:hypothetical protein